MQDHPLNLALCFLLELILLFVFAYWGWYEFNDGMKYLVAIELPISAAAVWGIFRVEGEPGKAIVAVPGWLRLRFEMILFAPLLVFLFQLHQGQ